MLAEKPQIAGKIPEVRAEFVDYHESPRRVEDEATLFSDASLVLKNGV